MELFMQGKVVKVIDKIKKENMDNNKRRKWKRMMDMYDYECEDKCKIVSKIRTKKLINIWIRLLMSVIR